MNTQDITRALRESVSRAVEIDPDDAAGIIDGYDHELDGVEERLVTLVRKHAGILPTARGDSPAQRLNSLRLSTAYPGVRKEALRKLMLDHDTTIANLAGPLLTALLKRDLAAAELAMEEERTVRVKAAQSEHRRNGIYDDVAMVADRLHALYGITYHHWKALSEDQLGALAEVLRGDGLAVQGQAPPASSD